MILRFGEFELDDALSELRRRGTPVQVQPKTLDLLLYLARHRERVVPKRELLERVWPGVVVSEGALTTAVNTARAVVQDAAAEQRVIRTVPRRGYRFVAELAAPEAAGPAPRDDFVGRENALSRLWSAFERTRAGAGGVALIAGEAGIGKSRTAAEFARAARAAGARVLSGRCTEGEGAPAYWPWVQVLRGFAPEDGRAVRSLGAFDEIVRLMPELEPKAPPRSGSRADGPEARFRLYDEVSTFLRAASTREPLVVLLDDLHWADVSSLRLLGFAARELGDSRVLLVGTYRPDESARPALGLLLAGLAREPGHERIELGGLVRDEVAQLVTRAARLVPEPALVELIVERTDGNPFFIRELVRMLESEGHLAGPQSRDAWRSATPLAVKDVIARRLGGLSEETRSLLGLAAVIGRDFSLDLLERASDLERDVLSVRLAEAERAREVRAHPSAPDRFRIVHGLIQEVLCEELGAARRRAHHRRLAQALDTLVTQRIDPPLAQLAHHWCLGASAEDAGRVASTSLAAAGAALARLAYDEAGALCRRALATLDALQAPAPEARCDLLALLVKAEFYAGNGPGWRGALKDAMEIARRIGSPQRLAPVAIELGEIVMGVVDPQAVAIYEESLAAADPRDGKLRAQLLSGLACALYWSAKDRPRIRALADEALSLARGIGAPELLAAILHNRHVALWGPDDLEDRQATSTELLALAERHGLTTWTYNAHQLRLLDALESGDWRTADRELAEVDRFGAELRFPGWASPRGAGLRALLDGRLDDAERLAHERFALISTSFANASMFLAIQLAAVRREQGRLGELEAGMRAIRDRLPAMPTWGATLAYLYAEDGRPEEARAEFEKLAGQDFRDFAHDATYPTTLSFFAEVAAFLRDVPRAHTLAERLAPYADRMLVLGPSLSLMSSVARPLALAFATSGDLEAAERHFAQAVALEERFGARCLVARTRQQHAAMLAERAAPGDRDRALALASEALATAEATGMAAVGRRARALVEKLSGVIPLRGRR